MRLTGAAVGILTLILLVVVPVGGSPPLSVGSHASYDLKAALSFAPPLCETSPVSGLDPMIVECPMVAMIPPTINVTGTIGWTATGLNSTTVALNVTHEVTISRDDLMTPSILRTGSFNESINLASRAASILPFLKTELDDALQADLAGMATPMPAGVDPSSAMSTVESTMIQPYPVYTMWWVNGPLKENQTIPVLVFPTNVTGSTNVSFGEQTRTAWTLVFHLARTFPQPEMSTSSPMWRDGGFSVVFTFNYDQKSDVLLSATADIHLGFVEDTIVQTSQCDGSTTAATSCPLSTPVVIVSTCGFNLHASLTLASTNLNLDQRLGSTGGSGSGSGSGSGRSGGTTGGSGGTSGGSGGTSGGSSSGGSGTGGGSGSGSGPNSNSGGTPQSVPTRPPSGIPWLYWLLAVAATVIVVTGLFFGWRRRGKKQA